MQMPPNDPNREKPLDHPTRERPHRLYVAMTNSCNRSCPWCSTCSSPKAPGAGTWLSQHDYLQAFPQSGTFQVQLEGGEPTIHPQFWEFVQLARQHPRCTHLVVCTNGVLLPRTREALCNWVLRLGEPLTIKLSVNHHLLDRDKGLIALAVLLRDLLQELNAKGGQRLLVLNVRLRRGYELDDQRVREAVESAGLLPHANIFFLQRYGFASQEAGWEPPAPVWHEFTLLNPDGKTFGPDLMARSEAMRVMP